MYLMKLSSITLTSEVFRKHEPLYLVDVNFCISPLENITQDQHEVGPSGYSGKEGTR